jgi:hypothetical protein
LVPGREEWNDLIDGKRKLDVPISMYRPHTLGVGTNEPISQSISAAVHALVRACAAVTIVRLPIIVAARLI